MAQIALAARQGIGGLLERAGLEKDQIIVVGCSTSEVAGARIGSQGSIAIAQVIMKEFLEAAGRQKIYLAIQGCEHINRALVVEKSCALQYGLELVNVMPHQRAGGALAETAMKEFAQPVAVEKIQGHAGLDIGDTLIGMHLKPVVVPVRLPISKIGQAHVTFAITRPKLIGGERAKYWDKLKA
ncbi:MAG: TIGR01440 family protein [Bacillota bacterium]